MRQGNLNDFGAHFLVFFDSRADGLFHFGVHALDEVFLRQADFEALHIFHQSLGEIRHFRSAGSGVHVIMAGDDVEDVRTVRHITGHRANLVQRRTISHEAIAGNTAVGRL